MFHKFSQEYLRTYTQQKERYGGELCVGMELSVKRAIKKLFFFFSQTIYAHRKSFLLLFVLLLLLLFPLFCSLVRKSFLTFFCMCKTKIFKNVNFFQLQHKKTSSTFTSVSSFRSHFCVAVIIVGEKIDSGIHMIVPTVLLQFSLFSLFFYCFNFSSF